MTSSNRTRASRDAGAYFYGQGSEVFKSVDDGNAAPREKVQRILSDLFPRYIGDIVCGYAYGGTGWPHVIQLFYHTFGTMHLDIERVDYAPIRRARAQIVDTTDHNYATLSNLLELAYHESPTYTLRVLFHLRDTRQGKGRRDVFRQAMRWYADHGRGAEIEQNVHLVPIVGRWDDVLFCPGGIELMAKQLAEDATALQSNSKASISLAAKWIPTPTNRRSQYLPQLLRALKKETGAECMDERAFRHFVAPVRKRLDLVETHMTNNTYSEIDYTHVPSRCLRLHGRQKRKTFGTHSQRCNNLGWEASARDSRYLSQKSDKKRIKTWRRRRHERPSKRQRINEPSAFIAHDAKRFNEFASQKNVDRKFDQVYPHELVNQYNYNDNDSQEDPIIEAQWQGWIKRLSAIDSFKDAVAMVDTSASMTYTMATGSVSCMTVAIALGLAFSMSSQDKWNRKVLTFTSEPHLAEIDSTTLHGAVRQVKELPFGMSTNVESAFELICHKVVKEDYPLPRVLLVLSDMNFNAATQNAATQDDQTAFERAKEMFAEHGLALPTVVFWNLSPNTSHYPAEQSTAGAVLLSGFSTSSLDPILKNNKRLTDLNITPWTAVTAVLEQHRYRDVVVK